MTVDRIDPGGTPIEPQGVRLRQLWKWILAAVSVSLLLWMESLPGGTLHTWLVGARVQVTGVTITSDVYDWNESPPRPRGIVEVTNHGEAALTACRLRWYERESHKRSSWPAESDPFELAPGEVRELDMHGPGRYAAGTLRTALRVVCRGTRSPVRRKTFLMTMKPPPAFDPVVPGQPDAADPRSTR